MKCASHLGGGESVDHVDDSFESDSDLGSPALCPGAMSRFLSPTPLSLFGTSDGCCATSLQSKSLVIFRFRRRPEASLEILRQLNSPFPYRTDRKSAIGVTRLLYKAVDRSLSPLGMHLHISNGIFPHNIKLLWSLHVNRFVSGPASPLRLTQRTPSSTIHIDSGSGHSRAIVQVKKWRQSARNSGCGHA